MGDYFTQVATLCERLIQQQVALMVTEQVAIITSINTKISGVGDQ